MKRLSLIILVTLVISGCSFVNQNSGSQLTPETTPDSNFTSVTTPTPDPTMEFIGELDYTTLIPETDEIKGYIEQNFIHYPTNILVTFKDYEIKWFCDNGGGINQDLWTDKDTEVWIENERAIYKGTLTKLDEGIYSSKGTFVPSMLTKNTVSESVDFYILIEGNKLTFVFDQMSLEKLKTLDINSYYYHLE